MTGSRPVTVLVEPDPSGHRYQAVANVAAVAGETGDVVLLTSKGASTSEAFDVFLAQTSFLAVEEPFTEVYPPTRALAAAVAAKARELDVDTVVVMDADQSLKRWWYVAREEFKGLPRRPRVVFMLTRYPAKLKLNDSFGWKFRISKSTLAMVAMATGTLHHVAGFAGREDMTKGWVVKRARDPEISTAHSRDRIAIRTELDLPQDRKIVGIFGQLTERKNAPLVLDALKAAGLDDVDLLLAGSVLPEVWDWINGLDAADRARVIVHDGFLTNELMDKLVAASDACPIALTNNGPSGIMGKALAAGVPVITAGSEVRARELIATDGGEVAELTPESIGAALKRQFAKDPDAPRRNTVPPATADEFSRSLLGVDARGRVLGRAPRR
jgi:glycosyltransferase involved in cell wall biosynthesis